MNIVSVLKRNALTAVRFSSLALSCLISLLAIGQTNIAVNSNSSKVCGSWDIESLRRLYSKPMSADQEVYNNMLFLYLSMKDNYSKFDNVKAAVYEFDHTKLSAEMKDFVARFVSLLDRIGEIERKISNCQEDKEKERSDSSFSSGFSGGYRTTATLSQFDPGGEEGFGAGTYALAGLIGGLVEANKTDERILEKYKRIVQEYREQEKGLYISFKQNLNQIQNSNVFKSFDEEAVLPEDVALSSASDTEENALRIIRCKVPALIRDRSTFSKDRLIICIANYPQSFRPKRNSDISFCYLFLSRAVLLENLSHYGTNAVDDISAIPQAELAAMSSEPIRILAESIKHDRGNHRAFDDRCLLRCYCGDYTNALMDINVAISISPEEDYFYNKACLLAKRFNDAQGAKTAIREAFKVGFCDIKRLKSDDDLAMLRNDPEFVDMTSVKTKWWYVPGIWYSEIFVKNESCFRLTNVHLESSCDWRWSLPKSGTVTLEPGETYSKDWYDNPPDYVSPSATIYCDQKIGQ